MKNIEAIQTINAQIRKLQQEGEVKEKQVIKLKTEIREIATKLSALGEAIHLLEQ